MRLSVQDLLDAPVIELDSIDSTNNYAMRLLDADTAQPGLTITALCQTAGKGQRGKVWTSAPGENVLMSIILPPERPLSAQFSFLAAISVAVAGAIRDLYESWQVAVKWPNDIIVNDKKAVGILIENILKGTAWRCSVAGIGVNVGQQLFPPDLPHVISLKMASGKDFDTRFLAGDIRSRVIRNVMEGESAAIMEEYENMLYRRGQQQLFREKGGVFAAHILGVTPSGLLRLETEAGTERHLTHGEAEWVWP